MQSEIKHVLLKYSRLQMFKDVKLAVFLMQSGIKCIIIKYSTHILYFSWHKMSSFYLQFGIQYVFMQIFHIMDVFHCSLEQDWGLTQIPDVSGYRDL